MFRGVADGSVTGIGLSQIRPSRETHVVIVQGYAWSETA